VSHQQGEVPLGGLGAARVSGEPRGGCGASANFAFDFNQSANFDFDFNQSANFAFDFNQWVDVVLALPPSRV
jgi:hypothetical protein